METLSFETVSNLPDAKDSGVSSRTNGFRAYEAAHDFPIKCWSNVPDGFEDAVFPSFHWLKLLRTVLISSAGAKDLAILGFMSRFIPYVVLRIFAQPPSIYTLFPPPELCEFLHVRLLTGRLRQEW